MTDDRVVCEGPYFLKEHGDNTWVVFGPCSVRPFALRVSSLNEAVRELQYSNAAYAEGRKAMEKDFKDLLEIANRLRNSSRLIRTCGGMEWVVDFENEFDAWKKARGIE